MIGVEGARKVPTVWELKTPSEGGCEGARECKTKTEEGTGDDEIGASGPG
jgi:hypothetical protein